MDPDPRRRVAVFLHDGAYDRVHQGCAIAAAAASAGRDVQLFLFWWALDLLLSGGFERPAFPADRAAKVEDAFDRGAPTAAQLLEAARETGHLTVYACSASAALLGVRPDEVAGRVDLVVGWTAILSLTEGVTDRFYL